MAPKKPAKPAKRSPKARKAAKPTARTVFATTMASPQPPTTASAPTKKEKVRACILSTFDRNPPKSGPETAPKDKWPDAVRWDTKANEIAKCIKGKFVGANQAELKELLLDNHATARKTLIDRLSAKLS